MNRNKTLLLGAGALLLLLVLMTGAGISLAGLFGQQTIVSADKIQFDDGSQKWIAAATVDGVNDIIFYKEDLASATGGKLNVQSSVRVRMTPQKPYCEYNLILRPQQVGGVFGYGAKTFYYYGLQTPKSFNPYLLSVQKFIPGSTLGAVEQFVIPETEKVVTVSDPSDSKGTIQISNLGNLVRDQQCPAESGTFIVQNRDGTFRAISETDYALAIGKIQDSWSIIMAINPVFALADLTTGAGDELFKILYRDYFSTRQIPAAWQQCTQKMDCSLISETNNNRLLFYKPIGSVNQLITVSMDSKFADGILIVANKGTPSLELALTGDLKQTESGTATATVTNVGTTDDVFSITISSKNGWTSFVKRTENTNPLAVNGKQAIQFPYYAAYTGKTDEVCAQAVALGSGQKSALICKSYSLLLNPAITPSDATATTGGSLIPDADGTLNPPITGDVITVACAVNEFYSSTEQKCTALPTTVSNILSFGDKSIKNCAAGFSYDSVKGLCVQAKDTGVLSCSEKAAAIQCSTLDLSCGVDKSLQQLDCTAQNLANALLTASIILVGGAILVVVLVLAFLMRKRRR